MNNLNSIIIEGNLTRDPEYHATPRGTPVCTFSVATNRFYKQDNEQQKEVSFFNVETWAKVADSCNQYLNKGRGVRVIGRLKQDRWVGQDGKNRDRIKIVAEHVEFKPVFSRSGTDDADDAGVDGEADSDEDKITSLAAAGGEEKAEEPDIAAPPQGKEGEEEDLMEAV